VGGANMGGAIGPIWAWLSHKSALWCPHNMPIELLIPLLIPVTSNPLPLPPIPSQSSISMSLPSRYSSSALKKKFEKTPPERVRATHDGAPLRGRGFLVTAIT
jgi:hypothetical protein